MLVIIYLLCKPISMQIYDEKLFEKPLEVIMAFNERDFKKAIDQVELLSKKYFLLGYIRYEAKEIFLNKKFSSKLPVLYFEVFDSFDTYKHSSREDVFVYTKPCINFSQYENDLLKIKSQIAEGNTYEVNYTYDWEVYTDVSEKELFEYLLNFQKTPYNTFIKNKYETLLSFSPELFFEVENGKILTKPMKGTVKRGRTKEEDEKNVEFLKSDIKNRAENVMIVDLLRNDLSKIAKTGTVNVEKLFEIETHKTIHQMTSKISAQLNENITLYEVLDAIFPCGSITGAPKISTMDIIDRTEKGKRDIYCGAIGFLSPQKMTFSVPIRILQKTHDTSIYKYRVGGAIVWDSDINDEWEETVAKAGFLNLNQKDFRIIETIRVYDKELLYKNEHFKRIKYSAEKLGFLYNEEIEKLVPEKDGIVRIMLSKNGSFETEYKELSEDKTDKIKFAVQNTISSNLFLYHKTTYRPWYEESLKKIRNGEIYDEIYFNEKGEVTEGSRTNIVIKINGKLYTPPLNCGLLNGVLRQKMLSEKQIEEKVLFKEDLYMAENIFCINSVRGIKEVKLL